MEFCPRCGAILIKKKKNDGCPRCNYSSKGRVKLKTSEKINEKKEIVVISEKDTEVHPVVEETCKKCGHNKCYFWAMQTRASDESETKFYKCVKCSHTWRDYD